MKTRLVLWGTDDSQERVLLALALDASENKVDIWTFPEQVATEALYNRLMNEWRMGKDIPLPNVFVQIQRPLTLSEPLIPENISVDRADLLHRAQTEWQFVVLSSKLYETYKSELDFIRDKVDQLDKFNSAIWEELKGFWGKVQTQIYDKNLYRDHGARLRDDTNALFARLKELRKSYDDEFRRVSRENAQALTDKLTDIESRIDQGLGLQPLFEELKKLQKEYKATDLVRDDRSRIWNRLDKAFKVIKEKRFGPGHAGEKSVLARLQRRYEGLISAIQKMERSIARDRKDQEFQDRRIEASEGQLESQIRQAKLLMINERIESKEAKLTEMQKTRTELERRIEAQKKKEAQQKPAESVEATPGSKAEDVKSTESSKSNSKAGNEPAEHSGPSARPSDEESTVPTHHEDTEIPGKDSSEDISEVIASAVITTIKTAGSGEEE